MNTLLKLAAVASVSVALYGCSDSSSDTSAASTASAYVRVAPLAKQVATIEVHDPLGILGAPTVTINQAEKITLDAHATSGVGTVTLDMSLVNNTGRALFNAKVVPTALSHGDVGTNTQGQTGNIHASAGELAGLEYWGFGLKGLANGKSTVGEDTLTVDGIVSVDNGDGTVSNSPLIIQVEMPTDHAMGYTNNGNWGDIERGDILGQRAQNEYYAYVERGGAYSWDNQYHQGAVSPDGQYLFLGTRNLPAIIVYDAFKEVTQSLPSVERIPLLEDSAVSGYTPSVTISPDGKYLYASVISNMHEGNQIWGSNPGEIFDGKRYLVKVDANSREVLARLEINMPGYEGMRQKLRELSITADGKLGAIAIDFVGGIALVDLDSMEVVKTFDTMKHGFGVRMRNPAIEPNGKRIFFADETSSFNYSSFSGDYSSDANIGVIDVKTGAYSKLIVADPLSSTIRQFEFGPDGRLYHVGDGTQVNVYDVNALAQVAVFDNSTNYDQFAFDGEGQVLIAFGNSGADVYELADDSYTGVNYGSLNAGEGFGLVSPY